MIHDKDVAEEKVLGRKFQKEVEMGKIITDRIIDDKRLTSLEKLIDKVDEQEKKVSILDSSIISAESQGDIHQDSNLEKQHKYKSRT